MDYDPRYLGGILFFNERDFFEAHEVWESMWLESVGPERSFVQGLIQAAVGLHHFGNGNMRGAAKLFHSSRDYMKKYPCPFLGLDHLRFWEAMSVCFADVLAHPDGSVRVPLVDDLIPTIVLDPAPASWPDKNSFEHED